MKYLNLILIFLLGSCLGEVSNDKSKQKTQILLVYSNFRDSLIAKDYKNAYTYTDSDFKISFTKDHIQEHFADPNLFDLTTIENKIKKDTIVVIKGASAQIYLGLNNGFGHVVFLIKDVEGKWKIKGHIGSWSDET